MRKTIVLFFLAALCLAVLVGCAKKDLAPYFTRIATSGDCGVAPFQVEFLAMASGGNPKADPTGGNIYLDITWDFGDGTTATGSLVYHTYTVPGTYLVTVVGVDEDGDVTDPRGEVTISVRPDSLLIEPYSLAGPAERDTINACANITFATRANACGFDSETGDYSRFLYSWRLDDPDSTEYPGQNPRHHFLADQLGTHRVELILEDPARSITRVGSHEFEVVPATVDLSLAGEVDEANPEEGDEITFTFTLTNNGPDDGMAVEITRVLPTGLAYVSDLPDQGTFDPETGVWAIGDLPFPSTISLALTTLIEEGTAASTLGDSFYVNGPGGCDPNTANDRLAVDILVKGADLDLNKYLDTLYPGEGDTVTFTLNLANQGPDDCPEIEVTDLLPPGVTFLSATPSQGDYNPVDGLWSVGGLAASDGASLVLRVTVNPGTSGYSIENLAQITAAGMADPIDSNNGDSVYFFVQ